MLPMRPTVSKATTLLLTAGVLLPAGIGLAHPFGANVEHTCEGRMTWDSRSGVLRQDVSFTIQGQKVAMILYVERASGPTGAPTVGGVWLESNGLDWLQKDDYVCTSPTHPRDSGPIPHPDTRLL